MTALPTDMRLEVFVLPVSDIDRSKDFYLQLGFNCDVDHDTPNFRVVQMTPPGSDCSITFGRGMQQDSKPGSYKGMHLIVTDIEATVDSVKKRGIEIGDVFHYGENGPGPGPHPDRIDYGSYAQFEDPDGNVWLFQEVPSRAQ